MTLIIGRVPHEHRDRRVSLDSHVGLAMNPIKMNGAHKLGINLKVVLGAQLPGLLGYHRCVTGKHVSNA
jgi:hypothetical protein